ncbi:MAG: EAL domain-containing protein, partial [Actinomycetota bacterium]|nr:EAL domain-containing protein [Actinomycetota bacterium]
RWAVHELPPVTTRPPHRTSCRVRLVRRILSFRVAERAASERGSEPSPPDPPARPKLPRLTLRFAVYTAIGLAFATASIVLLVRSYATSQAEEGVRYHARFVAEVALGDRLHPSDFAGPVSAERRATLDRLFNSRVVLEQAVRATLYAPDGTVTYATDRSLIGTRDADGSFLREALSGTLVRSKVADLRTRDADESRKVLKVLVPVRFQRSDAVGAFALYHDYAPIARTARHAFLPIAGVLELVLLSLYISLFPILRRVTDSLRRQLQEIEHVALHDSLTGLPNRRLFRDRVEQALLAAKRSGNSVAVMLIDLDRFKEINDTLGHQSVDVLLRELGARLRGLLREPATFARLGGDEFGVVLPQDPEVRVAEVFERIRTALEQPFVVHGLSLGVEASVGVAVFPRDGEDVDTLIKHADVAMYVAKEAHSGVELYEAERDSNDASRLPLASQLRAAIQGDELLLHFQPKVALVDGRIESVEALVRWQHPDRGLLSPSEFIALADETGLMKQLTAHVLDAALRQCRRWDDDGLAVRVAVNLDMRTLLDLRFPLDVDTLLRKWELDPGRLELEITEGTIMLDPVRVKQIATRLSALGVQLTIDDFGTGYSSLAYLHTLPVNEIKIYKCFLRNISDDASGAAIVRSIIDLGRNLGLRVVAEGVETTNALELLDEYGCGFAQGFLLAPPMDAAELALERLGTATAA